MSPTDPSYLCPRCRRAMCSDCKNISDEYTELLAMRTNALMKAEQELEEVRSELAREKHMRAEWERIAKLGYSDVLVGYIDSLLEKKP